MHSGSLKTRASHPCIAGRERVGFSPTRQTSRAPSAKCRKVFGESHEGWGGGKVIFTIGSICFDQLWDMPSTTLMIVA